MNKPTTLYSAAVQAALLALALALAVPGCHGRSDADHPSPPSPDLGRPQESGQAGPFQLNFRCPPAPAAGMEFEVVAEVVAAMDVPSARVELILPDEVVLRAGTDPSAGRWDGPWEGAFQAGAVREFRVVLVETRALEPTTMTLAITTSTGRQEFYLDVTPPDAAPRRESPRTGHTIDGQAVIDPHGE